MPRGGHIYVLQAGNGRVKVGFSKNPPKRAAALKFSCVLYSHPWHDAAELLEKAAHKILRSAGVPSDGEVFDCAVDAARTAIEQAADDFRCGRLVAKDRPFRNSKPINLTLDPDLVRRLDAWIEQQPMRTARSAVVEAAIVAFLDKNETPKKRKME